MQVGSAELFVVGSKGEFYDPKTPEILGPFARAVDANHAAIHVMYEKGCLTAGTLVYTTRLGLRLIGDRYVVFTQHRPSEVSIRSVQDAVLDHFDAIRKIGEKELEPALKENAEGVRFKGAHFINYRCTPEDTLAVQMTPDAPRSVVYANISIQDFMGALRYDAEIFNLMMVDKHPVDSVGDTVRYNARCLMSDVARVIAGNPDTYKNKRVEFAAINSCAVFLKPRSCDTQIRLENGEKIKV